MPKRIPIEVARFACEAAECRQVILCAWDGKLTHIVTYGKTVEDCAQAAQGGNYLKQKWGWPECNDQPSRVKKLQAELADAKERIAELEAKPVESSASPQVTPQPELSVRKKVYAFMELPYHVRLQRAQKLGVYGDTDCNVSDSQKMLLWIKRAKDKGV